MTTVYSGYSAGWLPSGAKVARKYRARLDYSVSAETDTTITYKAVLYVNIDHSVNGTYSGTLNLAGTTYSGSCTTKYSSSNPVNTVTCVSAKTKTFTKGETATTATIKGGVKSSSGSWTGATLTATATVSIPAKRYSITFDANGGSNPPASQKKIHGTDLTLTTGIPTRAGYDFVSWNTAADGSGTSYASGATFSTNAITTLYAQWHLSYVPPKIENIRAYRVANGKSGYNPDVLSTGTKTYAEFKLTNPVSGTVTVSAKFGTTASASSGTSGSVKYFYSSDSHLPTTKSETVTFTLSVTDYKGNKYTYTYSTFVSTENYIFDAFKGTSGSTEYQSFALGGSARDFGSSSRSSKGNFDCYMDADFQGNVSLSAAARTNLGLTDTGWVDLKTQKGTWNYCQYRYKNGIVYIRGYAAEYAWSGSTGDYLVATGTIPSQYRPLDFVDLVVRCGGTRWGQAMVTPLGGILVDRILNGTASYTSSGWIRFNVSYPV